MREIRCFNLFLVLVQLLFVTKYAESLYEDQIKKFDWKKSYIGKVKDVAFDKTSQDRLIVTTEENVLAAISARSGEILWRQVLEKDPRGNIKLMLMLMEPKGIVQSTRSKQRPETHDIITVSGHTPALVRGWSADTGIVRWEWSLMPLQPEKAEHSEWFYDSGYLYHVTPIWGSHLEVTRCESTVGQTGDTTSKFTAAWIREESCTLVGSKYVCADRNQLLSLDLTADKPQIVRKVLQTESVKKPEKVPGNENVVIVDGQLISLVDNEKICNLDTSFGAIYSEFKERNIILTTTVENHELRISAYYADTCEAIPEVQASLPFPEYYGLPRMAEFQCKTRYNTDKLICSYVLSTEDEALIFVQQNAIRWAREESLANVVAVELIDLPLSDAEGAIESELKSKPGDVFGAFARRISSQITHAKHIFLHVMGLGSPPTASQRAGLVRDAFGLHKMIVFVTRAGKIFGIDNLSAKQHWMRYIPSMSSFNSEQNMKLLVLRTSRHFPYQPLCAVIGKDRQTEFGSIFRFNPITGQIIDGGLIKLNYKIKQFALLRENENDFLKGLLVLDENDVPHAIPESGAESANGLYMFTADKLKALMRGLFIQHEAGKLSTTQIWEVHLGTQAHNHQIVRIEGKNPIEHVHSQGRVLSDRSVLYKYMNPNLVAVVTQGPETVHKNVMNIHLVDVVSGSVVFSMTHKKGKGPLHMVHSENWLAYSYYNDKVRRTEITTVELYESKVQANSTVWSSLDAPPLPLVERQSYIFPASIEAMRETITEKGITNKHVLIGISFGGIVEMPWALLDPRRPVSTPNQVREEGSIPYIPELPVPTENIINYNQSISRITNIFTAPSGLESTCLVVACGLDMFVTRVSPSKTFDLLKEDFDYFLITVVLIGLTTGSIIAKHLSSRKALKQAWK